MQHCRVIPLLLVAMTIGGCVEPDTSRPWSTKGQSLSGPDEPVVADREAVRTLPVYEVSEEVAIVQPSEESGWTLPVPLDDPEDSEIGPP